MGKTPPLANEQERKCLQQTESCTAVWVGKTPLLQMVRREVVCNIWRHELEFGWVKLHPSYQARLKWFATSGMMQLSYVGKTPPLLMVRKEVLFSIWRHAGG